MKQVIRIVVIIFYFSSSFAFGKEVSCIPRAEMGETSTGQNLYERDDDLNIKNLSHIDFDKLAITSAEGQTRKIDKVGKNIYKTLGTGEPWYFITNSSNTIVTELQVKESATYVKVLLCK